MTHFDNLLKPFGGSEDYVVINDAIVTEKCQSVKTGMTTPNRITIRLKR